jgi:hypothetical protein
MTTKVYLFPAERLSIEDLRKTLKQIKQDARDNATSTVEGGKQDASKTA